MDVSCEVTGVPGHGGDAVRVEVFRPGAQAEGLRPAIVIVHEVFGLDAFTRSVAERFSGEGYVVAAPDLYSRDVVPGPASTEQDPAPIWNLDQIRAAATGLPDRRAVGDLDAAVGWLAADDTVDADRIAVVGFCMGGNLAFLLGCHSRRVAAVVDFYGRIRYAELSAEKPVQPLELALNLEAPLLGLFGGEDESIPPEDVRAMEETLMQFAKTFELETFAGAGHGFFNHLRPNWREADAERAWKRTLAFLDETLI